MKPFETGLVYNGKPVEVKSLMLHQAHADLYSEHFLGPVKRVNIKMHWEIETTDGERISLKEGVQWAHLE